MAQDAPFGFIGIANNLNPLLESFQRLQVEAKATGTSLTSALKGALIGPAGIGLALGVVSSLLIVFGDKLFNAKSGAEKTADAIKKASQMLRDYEDSISDVSRVDLLGTQDAQGEIGKLQTLYRASQNINIPLAKRKQLVDELQAQYPKYFANIKDETILAGGAADAYNNLTAQILASSKARAAQELIVTIQKDLLTVEQQITDKQAERIQLEKQFVRERGKENPVRTTVDELGNVVQTTTKADLLNLQINKKLEEGNKLLDQRFQLQKRINAVASLLNGIVEKNPDAILPDTSKLKSSTSKKGEFNFFDKFFDFDYNGKLSEKQTSSLLDAANAFAKEFGGILEGLNFNKETQPASLQAAKDFWSNYRNGIVKLKPQKLIDDITVQPPEIKLTDGAQQIDDFLNNLQEGFRKINPNDVGLLPDALESQRITTLAKFEKLYRDIGLELPKIIKEELENGLTKPVEIKNIPTVNLDNVLKDNLQKAIQFRKDLNAIFANSFQSLFSNLGSSIGQAIAEGLSPLTAATNTIVDFMSSLIAQMGDALIQYGIVKTGIDKILKAGGATIPGGIAIALGVAAKIAAGLLKASKPKGFAKGGLVYGPTMGLVGEGRGTNRSNPEVIAPLDKLAQYIGGGNDGGWDRPRVRGKDILLATARTTRSQRRGG